MASEIYKYRIWCDTEGDYFYEWAGSEPSVCPNNVSHDIDPSKTTIEDEVVESKVDINNMATLQSPLKDIQRVAVQPGRTGYYMCDRDIKINTAMVGDSSFEDLKINTSDNTQENWGEFSLVACNKLVDGIYIPCVDQTDADTNAVMSIYDYIAINQSTEATIEYDFKGKCLWSDNSLVEPVWEHRMYAVMAPNIPAAYGGSCRFFDGYLYPYQGTWQEAVNSLALTIDPSVTIEAARIRFWILYPAGAKQNHVLRIITYRLPTSF